MKNRHLPTHQQTMFDSERPATRDSGPVTCLGMTFENDEAHQNQGMFKSTFNGDSEV